MKYRSDIDISAAPRFLWTRNAPEKSQENFQWRQYLLAILLVILATCLRAIIDPLFGETFPYITVLSATSAIAWYCYPVPATLTHNPGFLSAFQLYASPGGSFDISGIRGLVDAISYSAKSAVIFSLFFLLGRTEWEARENADRIWRKQSLLQNEMRGKESAQQAVVRLLRQLVQAHHQRLDLTLNVMTLDLRFIDSNVSRYVTHVWHRLPYSKDSRLSADPSK